MTNNIQTIENLIREAHAAMRNGQKIAALDLSGFAGSFHKDMEQFMEEWEKKSAPLFDGFFTLEQKEPEQGAPEQGQDWALITDYISDLYHAVITPISNGVVTISITDADLSDDVVEICHAVESYIFENCVA